MLDPGITPTLVLSRYAAVTGAVQLPELWLDLPAAGWIAGSSSAHIMAPR
jgi:hypothetical protein